MKRIRLLLVGGFLGAGKTTLIAHLARHFIQSGLRVGIVTNDQAVDLVDTKSLQAQGFDVGEITGACFCCNFSALVATLASLERDATPDVILGEPVGSCTDLVATVLEPLRHLHGERYELGPFTVLLKPEHGQRILAGGRRVGFSPKAAYIFLKQLEEADLVAINKIDKLSAEQQRELTALLGERFPDKPVFPVSARSGDGVDQLLDAIAAAATPHTPVEIDYDTYAEGEAELGWLNCVVKLSADDATPFALDDVVQQLVERIGEQCRGQQWETAHLKILGQHDDATAIANLVDAETDAELSFASGAQVAAAELTVNARVAAAPEMLDQVVRSSVTSVAAQHGLSHRVEQMQRFRPGRPVPTHRMQPGE